MARTRSSYRGRLGEISVWGLMLTFYHATDLEIDTPNYDKLLEVSMTKTHQDNGVMGLWCAYEDTWIREVHGSDVYTFEYEGNKISTTVENLEHGTKEEMVSIRKSLLYAGFDYIEIIDVDTYEPYCAVILNFDKIMGWRLL